MDFLALILLVCLLATTWLVATGGCEGAFCASVCFLECGDIFFLASSLGLALSGSEACSFVDNVFCHFLGFGSLYLDIRLVLLVCHRSQQPVVCGCL